MGNSKAPSLFLLVPMKAEPDYLALYSTRCFKCSHLVEGAPKRYKSCHFRSGNTQCPASEVKIVITGKSQHFLAQLQKARAERDAKAEAEVWTEVGKESKAFQARMYDLVNGKL